MNGRALAVAHPGRGAVDYSRRTPCGDRSEAPGECMYDELQLLDVRDVCMLLKVNEKVISAAVRAGHLRRFTIGGPRTYRFRKADVAAYIEWLVEHADD